MAQSNLLGHYSPESVIVAIGNDKFSHVISGYVDGTFISLTRIVEAATLYTGADATNSRVVRAVKNADVTLTLASTSESNDVLSQLLELDGQTRNDENIFYITIKDTSGRTVASSAAAFIGTSPDIDFGTDISERAWMIRAINMNITVGGNAKITDATFTTLTELDAAPEDYWNSAAV